MITYYNFIKLPPHTYQKNRVEAWLRLPFLELLLSWLQDLGVLAGGSIEGVEHQRIDIRIHVQLWEIKTDKHFVQSKIYQIQIVFLKKNLIYEYYLVNAHQLVTLLQQ